MCKDAVFELSSFLNLPRWNSDLKKNKAKLLPPNYSRIVNTEIDETMCKED